MYQLALKAHTLVLCRAQRCKRILAEGQGTTEYAILVGVLAVIAMIAIAAFKGKIQELWTAIADGVNGL